MTKCAKQYYSDIKTLIPSIGKYERKLLKSLKTEITNLDHSIENITYDDLTEKLGDPSTIITEYYCNCDSSYLLKRLQTKKIFLATIYAALILSITALGCSVFAHKKVAHIIDNTDIESEVYYIND